MLLNLKSMNFSQLEFYPNWLVILKLKCLKIEGFEIRYIDFYLRQIPSKNSLKYSLKTSLCFQHQRYTIELNLEFFCTLNLFIY